MRFLIPDNRETTALIWLAILFLWIASQKKLRASFGDLFRVALHPKILLPIIAMCGYVALEVRLANKLSLWRSDLLKPTLIWLAVSALAMLIRFDKSVKETHFYRHAIVEAIGIGAFLSFFMNVVVMSLPVELAVQPILAFITMISIVASLEERHRNVKKFTDSLLALIGFLLAGYTARQLYFTWPQIDKHGKVLELMLPVWLTIGYLPFIYAFSLFANYETAFKGIDWATKDRKVRWRGKIALLTKFHFRVRELAGFPWLIAKQIADAPSFSAARAVVADFQKTLRQTSAT